MRIIDQLACFESLLYDIACVAVEAPQEEVADPGARSNATSTPAPDNQEQTEGESFAQDDADQADHGAQEHGERLEYQEGTAQETEAVETAQTNEDNTNAAENAWTEEDVQAGMYQSFGNGDEAASEQPGDE